MVDFLLLINEITPYNKKDIDQGYTPPKVYQICACIKEAFCLSYAIRKENNLYLFFVKESFLVKLVGNELRFLGSDERSQAILLNKALDLRGYSNKNENFRWQKSTPGIFFINFPSILDLFFEHLESLDYESFILILNENYNNIKIDLREKEISNLLIVPNKCMYIIPFGDIFNNHDLILDKLSNIQRLRIQKVKMENFMISDLILYINYQWDLKEERSGVNNK